MYFDIKLLPFKEKFQINFEKRNVQEALVCSITGVLLVFSNDSKFLLLTLTPWEGGGATFTNMCAAFLSDNLASFFFLWRVNMMEDLKYRVST